MDQSPEDSPLARGSLSGSDDALVLGATPGGGSNKRAFKVAGLTTLACLLLASQVFTAYTVFGQKDQIHALQKSSEQMSRELTRPSRGGSPMRTQMPMKSLPLLRTFNPDEDLKTPMTKVQDTAISVEKQVKDLLQDSPLPQFNETFLANLQSLKQHMNETEWQSFETWMRYWLIFQMAQHQPATPTAIPVSVTQTKCQLEAAPGYSKIGGFKPQCDEQGRYLPMQCWPPTGFCWCVDESGTEIEGTALRGRPDCQRAAAPRRMMLAPRLMQRTLSVRDKK